MTDVQVSNARRVGFTALALVSFWVLAYGGYGLGADGWYDSDFMEPGYRFHSFADMYWHRFWNSPDFWDQPLGIGPSFALVPTLFWSLQHGPLTLRYAVRNGSNWLAGAVMALAIGACYCVGEWDVHCAVLEAIRIGDMELPRYVSWLWLLLPIILTTAFVIFGAWRRAVRDADAVGEDE